MGSGSQNTKPLVATFIAVANRAVTQQPVDHRFVMRLEIGAMVLDAGGEQDPRSVDSFAVDGERKALPLPLQLLGTALAPGDRVGRNLVLQR